MTTQDTQQVKDAALVRAMRAKETANIANEALNQAAESLEDIADVLRSPQRRVQGITFNSHRWLNPEPLNALLQEADRAASEFSAANSLSASLGNATL